MSTKLRDSSPERRRERKERSRSEKDRSDKSDKTGKKERHHRSSTHRTSSTKEKTASRTSLSSVESKRRSSMPSAIKNEDETPPIESRTSRPYSTFSKAHSKEAIGSHAGLNIFTPPATDVEVSKEKSTLTKNTNLQNGPPSPPLTDKNAGRTFKQTSKPSIVETIPEEEGRGPKEKGSTTTLRQSHSATNSRLRSAAEASSGTPVNKTKQRDSTSLGKTDKTSKTPQRSVSQPIKVENPDSDVETNMNGGSDVTSIAPEQPSIQRPGSKVLPAASVSDVQPQIRPVSQPYSRQQTPLEVVNELPSPAPSGPPPPPPPPPAIPVTIPRVDYLLHHGGLNQVVPKNLLLAGKPMAVQQAQLNPGQPSIVVANLFEPYNTLLGDFEKVMTKNGSLAVATGYKSVARRLLDRLEKVFSRDISCESCACALCTSSSEAELEDSRGVSWGEILELVSGRRELPNWPPFALVPAPSGLGISLEMHVPMQKVDIDVPEEYREHYIRQSRKTKQSVDTWLSRQADDPSSPPEEVDDETLTFSILTHLPVEQRQAFKDLLGIVDRPLGPPRRAPSPDSNKSQPDPIPTPQLRERPDHIVTAGIAIQRLYRLANAPRDPETAIFLLNNQTLHNALATMAAISSDEWDILTSGRFDGFLRSGAEEIPEYSANGRQTPGRGPSRNAHGHRRQGSYPSRQSTPAAPSAQAGGPIALDEDAEIAALAEIERDIYTGMETLEDAFEALHQRAEVVRRTLRERSAGLAAASQRRRGATSSVEIRMDTPANAGDRWEVETDDGLGDWDGVSEIAPDDSASNISSARRRRPKRRNERRTPALIEEDDEDYAESEGTSSPRKR